MTLSIRSLTIFPFQIDDCEAWDYGYHQPGAHLFGGARRTRLDDKRFFWNYPAGKVHQRGRWLSKYHEKTRWLFKVVLRYIYIDIHVRIYIYIHTYMYLLAIFSIISGVFLLKYCFLSYKTGLKTEPWSWCMEWWFGFSLIHNRRMHRRRYHWYIYIMLCNHAMLNIMYLANYDVICIVDTTYIHLL